MFDISNELVKCALVRESISWSILNESPVSAMKTGVGNYPILSFLTPQQLNWDSGVWCMYQTKRNVFKLQGNADSTVMCKSETPRNQKDPSSIMTLASICLWWGILLMVGSQVYRPCVQWTQYLWTLCKSKACITMKSRHQQAWLPSRVAWIAVWTQNGCEPSSTRTTRTRPRSLGKG